MHWKLSGPHIGPDVERVGRQFDGQLAIAVCDAIFASNQQLLNALAVSARMRSGAFPLPAELRTPLEALSEADRRGAAQCGILLADAGFADSARWRAIARMSEHEGLSNDAREWLASEDSVVLAHSVLMVAWYLVHTTPEAAGILLGMTDPVMEEYRSLGVGNLALIATRRPHWIRPRWRDRADVWRSLIGIGSSKDGPPPPSVALRCLSVSAAYSPHLQASLEARQQR